jgi:CMP-N-acetylneuraminic acid synthetase
LTHALEKVEQADRHRYDIVVMLQPTSPLRKPAHVFESVKMLVDKEYDAVWTVSLTDSKAHPLKQLRISNGRLEYYDPMGGKVIARQQLQPVYHRNGAAYAISRSCLLDQNTIKGRRTGAVIIKDVLVNIDTEIDLRLAEFFQSSLASA